MRDAEIEQLIARIAERIGRDYKPEKVILFGSYARGNPTEDSDIDLFIVKETRERMVDRFVEVKRLLYDPDMRIPVSPLVYTPEELEERLRMGDSFVEEIVSEGKVLYEEKR